MGYLQTLGLYRNCPGRKNPAQSRLLGRGSPDRDLTFIETNPIRLKRHSRAAGDVRHRPRTAGPEEVCRRDGHVADRTENAAAAVSCANRRTSGAEAPFFNKTR